MDMLSSKRMKRHVWSPRGDVQHDTYYNYESEDDTVFDCRWMRLSTIAPVLIPLITSTTACLMNNLIIVKTGI